MSLKINNSRLVKFVFAVFLASFSFGAFAQGEKKPVTPTAAQGELVKPVKKKKHKHKHVRKAKHAKRIEHVQHSADDKKLQEIKEQKDKLRKK